MGVVQALQLSQKVAQIGDGALRLVVQHRKAHRGHRKAKNQPFDRRFRADLSGPESHQASQKAGDQRNVQGQCLLALCDAGVDFLARGNEPVVCID